MSGAYLRWMLWLHDEISFVCFAYGPGEWQCYRLHVQNHLAIQSVMDWSSCSSASLDNYDVFLYWRRSGTFTWGNNVSKFSHECRPWQCFQLPYAVGEDYWLPQSNHMWREIKHRLPPIPPTSIAGAAHRCREEGLRPQPRMHYSPNQFEEMEFE